MGDLHACTWLGIVKNLAVEQFLGTSYIDRYIRGVFPAEPKIMTIHSRLLAILMSLPNVILIVKEDDRDEAIVYGSGHVRYFAVSDCAL